MSFCYDKKQTNLDQTVADQLCKKRMNPKEECQNNVKNVFKKTGRLPLKYILLQGFILRDITTKCHISSHVSLKP